MTEILKVYIKEIRTTGTGSIYSVAIPLFNEVFESKYIINPLARKLLSLGTPATETVHIYGEGEEHPRMIITDLDKRADIALSESPHVGFKEYKYKEFERKEL